MIDVLLRLDPRDGNDPIEAEVSLPIVPREEDEICVWVPRRHESHPSTPGEEIYLEVVGVVLCTYAPERIEVWVQLDLYDIREVNRVFQAIQENAQP